MHKHAKWQPAGGCVHGASPASAGLQDLFTLAKCAANVQS